MKQATEQFAAVQRQKAERAQAQPMRALVEAVAGKALGLALLWWGQREWGAATKTDGRFDEWAAIGAAVVGLYFVMPTVIRSFVSLAAPFVPWAKKELPAP